MITNRMYLDSESLVGLREWFATHFDNIHVLDLGGSSEETRRVARLADDENVFDILQGVAISFFVRRRSTKSAPGRVTAREVVGKREDKYRLLAANLRLGEHAWRDTRPSAEAWWLHRTVDSGEAAGREFALSDVFPQFSTLVASNRDHLVVDMDREVVLRNVGAARAFRGSNEELARQFEITLKTGWNVTAARAKLREIEDLGDCIAIIEYRPFDRRWIFFHPTLVWQTAPVVSANVLGGRSNRVLISLGKNRAETVNGQWVSSSLADKSAVSTRDNASGFPLYLYPGEGGLRFSEEAARPNLSPEFLRHLAVRLKVTQSGPYGLPRGVSPQDVFQYIYAVLYCPGYRSRYAESLKVNFPRLPLPGSLDFFRDLARLGAELVALHLMESPKLDHFITTYIGPKNPNVLRVLWSDDTVWLDADATKKGQPTTPGTIGFRGVPEAVWNFHIGGYQVCEKWLKDRKGRTLSEDDIAHYQKIVVALNETIRLMKEIDEVIEAHGGWPGAFQTAAEKSAPAAAPAKVIPFRPRVVEPRPEERYVTCVPLVPLKAAAGAFSDPQHIEDDGWEWTAVDTKHRLRPGMFVAQVVGKSMEPAIPDGSYCLFAAPVEGTRQGKTVLVQLRDATDSETGERYTVKRYESEKTQDDDSWRHAKITLKPVNPDFEPIVLTESQEGEVLVIAECVDVLDGEP